MTDAQETPLGFLKDFQPITIKDLIYDKNFIVPPNQRDFSWDANEIDELWDDIIQNIKNNVSLENKKYHFFGPMFFIPSNDKKIYKILDGQQRLATVVILLSVIRDMIYYSSDDIYLKPTCLRTEIDGFIQRRDKSNRNSILGNPILVLGDKNGDYFKNLIQKIGLPYEKFISKSDDLPTNRLIKKVYRILSKYIYLYLDDKSRDEKFKLKKENILEELKEILKKEKSKNKLSDLFYCILDNFFVLKIEVEDPAKAFKIFETLNDRGIKLTVADLFKNILSIKIKDADDIKEANHIMNEISTTVEKTGVRMDIFLRHYWMANSGFVRQKDLFDEISKKIDNYYSKDIIEFLGDILKFAEVYVKFEQPTTEAWDGQKDIKELLDNLNTLRVVIIRPLLYMVNKEWKIKGLKDILKISVNLFLRNTISSISASRYETKYTELCTDIKNKSKKSVSDVTKELEKIMPKDKKFEEGFERKTISSDQLARYIIGSINDVLLGKSGSITDPKITLEHILPQSLNECDKWWEIHLKNKNLEHGDLVNRLGNFTLLTEKENEDARNKGYPTKYKIYSASSIPITKDLQKFKDWDNKTILEREQFFAEIAIKRGIWGNYK